MKSDVLLLTCVFEKSIKKSFNEFEIVPIYCVSLPGYIWQSGLNYTGISLLTFQDKDMILLLQNNTRGGTSSVLGDRYLQSDENKKILYIDATNIYGHSMSQMLPYDEIKCEKDICLEERLNTPAEIEIDYISEVDLKFSDNIKKETKNFAFAPVNEKSNPDNFSEFVKTSKPDTYTQTKKLM